MFRIIVAGSREFDNYEMLNAILEGYISKMNKENITIVSGRANGADKLGEVFAENHNLKLELFPADWQKYGNEAGFIRNGEMANYATEEGNYGVLFAFWDGKSNGTKDMINKAMMKDMEKHIIVYKVNEKGEQELSFETDTLDCDALKKLEEDDTNKEENNTEEFMNPPEGDDSSNDEE